jgi:hypothetical protein
MVVAAIVWVYAGLVSALYGQLTLIALQRWLALDPGTSVPLALLPLVGLWALATLSVILSLIGPLALPAHLVIVAGAVVYGVADRRRLSRLATEVRTRLRRVRPGRLVLVVGIFAIALERTAGLLYVYDTGLYHAQAIRWLEEYGTVAGLGNLHMRLAFPTAWFPVVALFSLRVLGLGSLHVLTGLVVFLFVLYALGGLDRIRSGQARTSGFVGLALVPALFLLFANWLSSPTPDVVATILTWTVGLLALEQAESGRLGALDARGVCILALASFAAATKVSALPILLLVGVLAWRQVADGRRRRAVAVLLVAAIPVLVVSMRTFVGTGYPVYPLYPVPPFNRQLVDWAIPAATAHFDVDLILAWARIPGPPPDVVLATPLWQWVPGWYGRLRWPDKRAVEAILAFTPLMLGAIALRRPRGSLDASRRRQEILVGLVFGVGLAWWFATAPDPRLGWGFLIFLALWLPARLVESWLRRLPAGAVMVGLGLWLYAQAALLYGSDGRHLRAVRPHLVVPRDYWPVEVVRIERGTVSAYAPRVSDQCGYQAFPCTSYRTPPLELRGPTLAQGFKVAP